MRAVIYKRVSVLKNNIDGTSLDVQQERLEAYAKSQGWQVIGVYEDAGISGKDTNRPELQRMLKDAEKGKFDAILVYKLDRLTRSVADFHKLSSFLDRHKITLVSVTQHLDTSSSTGRLLRNILIDFANFERELITERIVDNKTHRAQEGKWNGGHAPFGYQLVDKKLVLVPEEAEKVKEVYSLYLHKNKSMRQVARETGISFSRVELILMNPIYAGKVAWGKTKYKNHKGQFERKDQEDWIMVDGEHEAVISFKDWEDAQEIKKNNYRLPKDRSNQQIFKDICYCGKCGQKLYFYKSGSSQYTYYRCHDVNRFEGCKETSVLQPELEKKVIRKIDELLTNKSYWKKVDEKLGKKEEDKKVQTEYENVKQAIAKTDRRIKNLIMQLADSDIAHLIKPQLLELEQEKKQLLSRQTEIEAALEENEDNTNPDLVKHIMKDMITTWDFLSIDEKSEAIHILIDSIKCYEEHVRIKWTDENLPEVGFQLDKRAKNGRILSFCF